MPRAECPHCTAQFPIKNPDAIGKVRPCPRCGGKFRVKNIAPEEEDVDELIARHERRRLGSDGKKPGKRKRRKQKPEGARTILGAIVGGVVFLVSAFGGFMIVSRMMQGGGENAANNHAGGGGVFEALTGSGGVTRREAATHLQKMVLGMHKHLDTHNEWVPVDKSGLSWRVHLLPFVGEQALYEQFHLDEPWDSEHNRTLIENMPEIYRSEGATRRGYTGFRVVSGSDTMWPFGRGATLRDVTDGSSNTIVIVQAVAEDKQIEWTNPAELSLDPGQGLAAAGPPTAGGWLVAFVDGKVMEVNEATPASESWKMLNTRDGEVFDTEWMRSAVH